MSPQTPIVAGHRIFSFRNILIGLSISLLGLGGVTVYLSHLYNLDATTEIVGTWSDSNNKHADYYVAPSIFFNVKEKQYVIISISPVAWAQRKLEFEFATDLPTSELSTLQNNLSSTSVESYSSYSPQVVTEEAEKLGLQTPFSNMENAEIATAITSSDGEHTAQTEPSGPTGLDSGLPEYTTIFLDGNKVYEGKISKFGFVPGTDVLFYVRDNFPNSNQYQLVINNQISQPFDSISDLEVASSSIVFMALQGRNILYVSTPLP